MATKYDVLRSQFNKIPYDPEVDSCNLNEELVNEMCKSSTLENMIRNYPSWTNNDIEQISTNLKKEGWALWEIEKVIESYNPQYWESANPETKNKIKEIVESIKDNPEEAFNVDFDLYPYRISKSGIEKQNSKDNKENYETITDTPIVISAIGQNLDDDTCLYQCTLKNVTGQISKRWLTPDQLLASDMKALINFGLQISDADFKYLKQFFKKQLKYSYSLPKEFTATKSGWKQDNSILITGSYAHTAEGKKPILALTDEIANLYTVKGSKKEWGEVLTPLLEFDLVRIKCYSAVAAMLVRLVNVQSFVVHNYHESSGLKSVTMQLAASVVGNPFELIRDADCTKVGLEMTAVMNTDTPLFFDETSNNKEFSDAIYLIANEKGKTRGDVSNSAVGLAKIGRWKTVVQTTGEYSLTQYLSLGTGVGMRVIEIFEGIPKLDENYVEKVKETIANNYGLFLDEIVQQIFIAMPNLKTRFYKIREMFEKSSTTFAARKKNYFAVLALAGLILEGVFKNNEIETKDPVEICKRYYEKTAVSDPTIPYYKKALDTVFQWYIRNKKSFEYNKDMDPEGLYSSKGVFEVKGWVTTKGIVFEPDMLKKYLEDKGLNFDRAIQDWTERDIIVKKTDGKTWKYETRSNGQRVYGLFITFEKMKEVLNVEIDVKTPENENEVEKINEEDIIVKDKKESSRVGLRKACIEYLAENPVLKNVTHSSEEVAKEYINTKQGSECLLHWGFSDIVNMFSKVKQGI